MIKDKDGDTLKIQKAYDADGNEAYVAMYTSCVVNGSILYTALSMGSTIGFGDTIGEAMADAYLKKHLNRKFAEQALNEAFSRVKAEQK